MYLQGIDQQGLPVGVAAQESKIRPVDNIGVLTWFGLISFRLPSYKILKVGPEETEVGVIPYFSKSVCPPPVGGVTSLIFQK